MLAIGKELREYVKSRIVFRVVEEGGNQSVVEGQLMKDYGLGLKMLFLVDLSKRENKDTDRIFLPLTESYLENMEMELDAEQAYQLAIENMPRLYPTVFLEMADMIPQAFRITNDSEIPVAYVLTNQSLWYGAANFFLPGVQEKIGEHLDGDYFALPSSLHEWIILPVIEDNGQELKEMVMEINQNEMVVLPVDKLSDRVFRYDCKKGKLVVDA